MAAPAVGYNACSSCRSDIIIQSGTTNIRYSSSTAEYELIILNNLTARHKVLELNLNVRFIFYCNNKVLFVYYMLNKCSAYVRTFG